METKLLSQKCVETGCTFETAYPFSMLCHEKIHATLKLMDPKVVSLITAVDLGLLTEDPVEGGSHSSNESPVAQVEVTSSRSMNESNTSLFTKNDLKPSNSKVKIDSGGKNKDAAPTNHTNPESQDCEENKTHKGSCNAEEDFCSNNVGRTSYESSCDTLNVIKKRQRLKSVGLVSNKFEKRRLPHNDVEELGRQHFNTRVPDALNRSELSQLASQISEDDLISPESSINSVDDVMRVFDNNDSARFTGMEFQRAEKMPLSPRDDGQPSLSQIKALLTEKTISSTGIVWKSYSDVQLCDLRTVAHLPCPTKRSRSQKYPTKINRKKSC